VKEYHCWYGEGADGWAFDVVLFDGLAGEVRFSRHGEPMFTEPIGLNEIAMFISKRMDLIEQWLDGHTNE
jgi:hypothetical protein